MTTTTTTKSPGDPSSRPNRAAASRRRAPARAAPTIPWTGVSPTRRITCGTPPAGPRSCHRPRGRRPADGDDAFEGTARRCRRCRRRRRQPPPRGRRRPSSPPPSPPPPSILLLHLPLPGIKLVGRRRCRTSRSSSPIARAHSFARAQSIRGGLVESKLSFWRKPPKARQPLFPTDRRPTGSRGIKIQPQ